MAVWFALQKNLFWELLGRGGRVGVKMEGRDWFKRKERVSEHGSSGVKVGSHGAKN